MSIYTIIMRILKVIARIIAKQTISPGDIKVSRDICFSIDKYPVSQTTLFGRTIVTDDAAVFSMLDTIKLIPEFLDEHNSPLWFVIAENNCARLLTKQLEKCPDMKIDLQMSVEAARSGSIGILEVLENADKPIAEDLCTEAAIAGKIDTLKWLRAHNFAWGEETTIETARQGEKETLMYLRDEKCPWPQDGAALMASITEGNMATLRWQLENGCPIPRDVCYQTRFAEDINEQDQEDALETIEEMGRCTCEGEYHPGDTELEYEDFNYAFEAH